MNVSIIIPVYNDPDGLRDTVYSFARQNYLGEYEIIVVDNNSTDGTSQVANDLADSFPCVAVFKEVRKGAYAARNCGVSAASGEILCFADADTTVEFSYLSAVSAQFEEENVDYLGARVNLKTQMQGVADKYEKIFAFPVEEYMETFCFAPTCCLSVRKTVLEDVGGFDSRLESGGDKDFGRKVHAAGYLMKYSDKIVVNHPARSTRLELFQKARRIGRGIAQQYFYNPLDYGDHYKACFSPLNLFRVKIFQVFAKNRKKQACLSILDCLLVAWLEWQLRIVGAYSTYIAYSQMRKATVK